MGNCTTCDNCGGSEETATGSEQAGSSNTDKRTKRRPKSDQQTTALLAEEESSDSPQDDGPERHQITQPSMSIPSIPAGVSLSLDNPNVTSDPTLGGIIHWRKVAELSALMSREIKLKVWNGVFKKQDYRRSNQKLPDDIKRQLPSAVKEPSAFIVDFLKKDSSSIHETFLGIYKGLSQRYQTEDESKKQQFEKNLKRTKEQWQELTSEVLKKELNRHDFLKAAWLQYMLYAYRNHVNELQVLAQVQSNEFGSLSPREE